MSFYYYCSLWRHLIMCRFLCCWHTGGYLCLPSAIDVPALNHSSSWPLIFHSYLGISTDVSSKACESVWKEWALCYAPENNQKELCYVTLTAQRCFIHLLSLSALFFQSCTENQGSENTLL